MTAIGHSSPGMQQRSIGPRYRSGLKTQTGPLKGASGLARMVNYLHMSAGGDPVAQVAAMGRGKDTELAHFSPDELQLLDQIHGGRQVNPQSGLPEYGWLGDLLKGLVRAAGAVVGGSIAGPVGSAIGTGLTTKLTGGSWNQALQGGAMSGLGSYGAQVLTGGGFDPTKSPNVQAMTTPNTGGSDQTIADTAFSGAPATMQASDTKLADAVLSGQPGAADQFWKYARTKPAIAAALGALETPTSNPSAAASGTNSTVNINGPALPGNQIYNPRGVSTAYPFYGPAANTPSIYGPPVPQGYADGGPVAGLTSQSQLAGLLRGFQMAKNGGRVRRLADGGSTDSSGDNEGENQGANPIVVPSNVDMGAISDLRDFENEMQNYSPNFQNPDYSSPTAGNTGFLDRVGNALSDAWHSLQNDLSNPGKGLQDLVSGTTGLQFKPGDYTATQSPGDYGKLNVNFQSDPTWNPSGINPLTAASYLPGVGQLAGLANLGSSIAGYDPTISFGNGSETPSTSPGGTNGEINVAANQPNTQQYGPPIPPGDPGTFTGGLPAGLGQGGGGVGGAAGVPFNPGYMPPAGPQIASAQQQYNPIPTMVPSGGQAPVAAPPQIAPPNASPPAPGGRVYNPYLGNPNTYGEGPVHQFYAGGGSVMPDQRAVLAAMGERSSLPMGGAMQMPQNFDRGGASLGAGDGTSDHIPAMLSDGEYVIDSASVADLGNGSTKAGIKKLDQLRTNLRAHKRSAPASSIPPKAKPIHKYMKISARPR